MAKPINKEKVLSDIYNGIALLSFGDLLLLQTQVSEHIHNCWQHHQLQIEKTRRSEKNSLVEWANSPDDEETKASGPSDPAYDA